MSHSSPSARRRAHNAKEQVSAVPVGPLFWDALPSGRLLADSPTWRAYTGQPEPLPESGWLDSVVHAADREATMLAWAHALQAGQPLSLTHRLLGVDGTYRSFLTQARPVQDEAGNIVRWQGVSCDLTEIQQDHEQRQSPQQQTGSNGHKDRRDLETALADAQAAEAKFHTVIDRNIIGIFVADADAIIEANDAFLQMVGYSREDVAAHAIRWLSLTPPGWTEADDRASQELLTRGACAPYEKVYLHRDGTPIPIILAGVLLSLQPLRIMAFALDITERQRLAHEVAARAAELEAVFDAMADAVYVYDAKGELLRTNAAARALNPRTVDATYRRQRFGDRIAAFAVRDANGVPLDSSQTPVARIQRGDRLVDVESQMRLPDGHDLQLSTSGGPIRDQAGQITGAVIVTRDVSARHRLEQQNQAALNVLLRVARIVTEPADARTLLTRLAEALWQLAAVDIVHTMLIDASLQLELVAVYGLPDGDEASWREMVHATHPVSEAHTRAAYRQLSAGQLLLQHFPEESPLITVGVVQRHHIRTAITAPIIVNGRLVGLLTAGRMQATATGDVDDFAPWDQALLAGVGRLAGEALERARLTEQLTQAEAARLAAEEATRQRDTFLGIASHELRTPLTSIKANLQITSRAFDRFAETHVLDTRLERALDLLRRTDRHISRLDRIVEDLLDMVRFQSGTLQLHPTLGDLAMVVSEAVEEQRLLWPDRAITLALRSESVLVEMDAGRIGQVVTNYLVNALKYSPADAPVVVSMTAADGMARVAVSDHGKGIPLAEQERIWDRFYRSPQIFVESGSGVGLGLGLFVCRELITRHGGTTGVTSAPGKGATFWFVLPLA